MNEKKLNIYAGAIVINNFQYKVYIIDKMFKKNYKAKKDVLYITEDEIDIKWINKIKDNIINLKDDVSTIDDYNKFYLHLYILFFMNPFLTYEHVLHLESINSAPSLHHKRGERLREKQYNILRCFMERNSYKYMLIQSVARYSLDCPKMLFYNLGKGCFFSRGGCRCFTTRFKNALCAKTSRMLTGIDRAIKKPFVERKLKRFFDVVKIMRVGVSGSGCLFYDASKENQRYFLKCGAFKYVDIVGEYYCAAELMRNSTDLSLYVLPIMHLSSPQMLSFKFAENLVTLDEVLENRNLTKEECDLLFLFAIDVLDDLDRCHIVHRDIYPSNILVLLNDCGTVVKYKLIDFGLGIVDNMHRNNSVLLKHRNRKIGNWTKYSDAIWDDAVGFIYLMSQISDVHSNANTEFCSKLESLLGRNTYTMSYE